MQELLSTGQGLLFVWYMWLPSQASLELNKRPGDPPPHIHIKTSLGNTATPHRFYPALTSHSPDADFSEVYSKPTKSEEDLKD